MPWWLALPTNLLEPVVGQLGPPAVTKKDLIILKESLRCLAEKNADTREALVERIENIQMELLKERGKRGTLRINQRK